jgi:phage tail sheath gpL-like
MAIGFSNVPSSAAASAVFVEQQNVRRGVSAPLTHRVLLIGQYNSGQSPTDNQPQLLQSVADAQNRYGRGSMLAVLADAAFRSGAIGYEAWALPVADDGSAVAASGEIAVSNSASADGTVHLTVAGVEVDVAVSSGDDADTVGGAIADAINAESDLPVTASNSTGTVTVTARNGGEAGNQIQMALNNADNDETPAGLTVSVDANLSSGANNPAIDTALGNLGDTWFTEVVCPYLDDTSISALEAAGRDRNDPSVKRPFIGFIGYTDTRSNLLSAVGTAGNRTRNSEFSSYIPVHGSLTTAFEIAAAFAGMWARHHAGDKVGRPVYGNVIPGVRAGSGNELTYSQRDSGLKLGVSHTFNSGSGALAGDTATTRIESDQGVATESYRFAIIIPNLQVKINEANITYGSPPFTQTVVLTDDTPGAVPFSVRPKTAKGYAIKLVDSWIAQGLSTDRETIVSGIQVEIDSGNPGRINVMIPDIPSAGLRILAAKLEWDFIV